MQIVILVENWNKLISILFVRSNVFVQIMNFVEEELFLFQSKVLMSQSTILQLQYLHRIIS